MCVPAATGAPCTALGRAAEAGRRRGLRGAVDLDEGVALDVVRMGARLRHRQHRREAHLVTGEERRPTRALVRVRISVGDARA